MRMTVIGGAGHMGRAIIRDLMDQPDVSEILVADIDEKRGQSYVESLASKKVIFRQVDVSDHETLVRVLRGSSVVLNATWIELYMPIFSAALEARVHYVDLGGLYYGTMKQLQHDEEFRKAGVTAILCMGASPGITNISAAEGAKKFDEIEEIKIRTGSKGGKGFAYTPRTILDECMKKPVVFKEGTPIELEPFSGFEKYRLPDPVGEVEGFYSLHSETLTFPTYINKGVRNVSFKVAFSPSLVRILNMFKELGFLSTNNITVKGTQISPREFLDIHLSSLPVDETLDEYKSFRVELIGKHLGKKAHWAYETVVESRRDWQLRATAVWTGVPAAIAALMLGRGEFRHGVYPPEAVLDSGKFIAELAKRHIHIMEREVVEP